MQIAKRGRAAVAICSSAFTTLGRAQARALGHATVAVEEVLGHRELHFNVARHRVDLLNRSLAKGVLSDEERAGLSDRVAKIISQPVDDYYDRK